MLSVTNEFFMLNAIMLGVVVMLSVIVLNGCLGQLPAGGSMGPRYVL